MDYRIRRGNYRILYVIDERRKAVEVISVGNRKDVYKRLK
jgi:mRNA-degrading endonuclease RelE of RelBE toxin-antitoxin system